MHRVARVIPVLVAAFLALSVCEIRAAEADPPKAADTKAAPEDEAKKMQTQISYRLELADVHMKYGANEVAESVLEQAIKLGTNTKDPLVLRAHFMRGAALQKQDKWKDAAAEYESIQTLVTQPNDQVVLGALISQAYDKLKDPAKAEAALLALTDAKYSVGVRAEGWKRLIAFWKENRAQLDTTLTALTVSADKDGKDANTLERLATIYTDILPDTKKAETYTAKLAELGAKETEPRLRLAGLYERQKQYEKAIKVYQDLIPVVEKAAAWDIDVRCAILMVQSGKREEAVAKIEKELTSKAKTALETVGLAGFYTNASMPLKAEETFVKAASLSQSAEDITSCLLAAAESCRRRKDFSKAEEYLLALLRQFRDNKTVRTQVNAAMVKLYDEQGKLGDLNLQQP
ncbi:MAG TPA: tetratricopeptide repeat protein [Planctomycetota bacterium]|jgi:tetratricopeptide (TPR) repeat protein